MTKTFTSRSVFFALILAVLTAASTANARGDVSQFSSKQYGKLVMLKVDKKFKMRGMQLTKKVYMGQAKIAGKYGLGVVVNEGSFVWGFNNRGLAIMKKF